MVENDIATVKAQIKAWEKTFKSEHGKDPSVQDIKNNPDIAAKYKLYKALNKASQSSSQHSLNSSATQARSSTPPKRRIGNVFPSSRPLEPPEPLSSYNPFSPQKKTTQPQASSSKLPEYNPFATPVKRTTQRAERTLSPSRPTALVFDRASLSPAPVGSAISRARKRLRGEPVSPSPAKGKRRRVESNFQFASHSADSDSDDAMEGQDAETSFVDDSPVKKTTFKLLFKEQTEPQDKRSARSESSTRNLKSSRGTTAPLEDWDMDDGTRKQDHIVFKDTGDTFFNPSRQATAQSASGLDMPDDATEDTLIDDVSLIPPSPPRNNDVSKPSGGQGRYTKGKSKWSTKLLALTSEVDEHSDDTSHANIRLVSPQRAPRNVHEDDMLVDGTIDQRPTATPTGEIEESVDVKIRDDLLPVLSLSDAERRESKEKVVAELLYGRRERHYYPQQGGEVWDAGDEGSNDEGEGDWEEPPVPWEVAEM